jgi:protein gp37
MSKRLAGRFGYPADDPFRPTFHPDRLDAPLHWRKPRRIFVNSMSDLFHEAFTDGQIMAVFDVMRRVWNWSIEGREPHTFSLLTKRPERMRDFCRRLRFDGMTGAGIYLTEDVGDAGYPLMPQRGSTGLPNIWLGVTVENQERADKRIPILLDTPAAVRFVCCEPLLGAVDLVRGYQWARGCLTDHYKAPIDWVIVGGENGPGARQMKPEWALGVYRQCKAVSVPFWWKGAGAKGVGPYSKDDTDDVIDMMCCHELPAVTS